MIPSALIIPRPLYRAETYDPYFGTTTADFVTQIRLGEKWDGLPFTVDSMKLYLHLLTAKGGSNLVHSISIYEIANQIYTDSAYYANTAVPLTGFKLENIYLPALRTDTINDLEITLPGNGLEFGNILPAIPRNFFTTIIYLISDLISKDYIF